MCLRYTEHNLKDTKESLMEIIPVINVYTEIRGLQSALSLLAIIRFIPLRLLRLG